MEKSIIVAAVNGDQKSFKMIFNHYLPRMRPISLRYARTSSESEDILQDSFVKIYQNIKSYKFHGSFEGWVKTIVINTALNYYKKNRRINAFENIDVISETRIMREEGEDEEEAINEWDSVALMNAINELPEGYKMVFNLFVLDGFSHKKVAEMLGISEGTSRSQFSKARRLLRKIISQATK